jgi:hypothetical protein
MTVRGYVTVWSRRDAFAALPKLISSCARTRTP